MDTLFGSSEVRVLLGLLEESSVKFIEKRYALSLGGMWRDAAAEVKRNRYPVKKSLPPSSLTRLERFRIIVKQLFDRDAEDLKAHEFRAIDLRNVHVLQPIVSERKIQRLSHVNVRRMPWLVNEVQRPVLKADGSMLISCNEAEHIGRILIKQIEARKRAASVRFVIMPHPNFITVVQYNDCYILVNGTHRAVSMLSRGVTRTICAIVNDPSQSFFDQMRLLSKDAFDAHLPLVSDFLDRRYFCRIPDRVVTSQLSIRIMTAERVCA